MKLEIITPERIQFTGNISSITLPGVNGKFTVLENHASLIASLTKGVIKFKQDDNLEQEFLIEGGLCEVIKNQIYVCVEQSVNGNSYVKVK